MLLQGLVLSGDVLESTFFDQVTGLPKPGFSVKLTVLDAETDEKYECQVSEGFASLDQLKELKRQGQSHEVLQQVAEQLLLLGRAVPPVTLGTSCVNSLTAPSRFCALPASRYPVYATKKLVQSLS